MGEPKITQLKDDCFAFNGELMPVADAIAMLEERLAPVTRPERVPLRHALSRILCEDIRSERDVPPHDNSAVDGYAVYFDDLAEQSVTRLVVTGRVAAGHPLGRKAKRGEAIRIFTGAPIPDGDDGGPDTVFMEEDTTADGDGVVLPPGLIQGANRRRVGEDVKAGDVVIGRGRRLRAQEIGLAASIGHADLLVYRRLRTAVFSTGDEVRDPTDVAPEGCIFDSNRYAVMSLLEGLGCEVTDLGIFADDEDGIATGLEEAAPDHDLLVTSGGVSAGEEDHVKGAVERQGQIHFWRLAIKPGRPIALGQVGDTAFVGLPGNPVAAMVTFMFVARSVVLRLAGATDIMLPRFQVKAGFDYKKKTGRREWARVKLVPVSKGLPEAIKYKSGGAGILTSMVEADGLIEIDEDVAMLNKGEPVNYLPFSELTR